VLLYGVADTRKLRVKTARDAFERRARDDQLDQLDRRKSGEHVTTSTILLLSYGQ
jgi:hypothetical protein